MHMLMSVMVTMALIVRTAMIRIMRVSTAHMSAPPGVAMLQTRSMIVIGLRINTMLVSVTVIRVVTIGGFRKVAPQEERQARPYNHQARRRAQPRVELLGHDPLRRVQGDDPQRIDRYRMRRSYDAAEKNRVTCAAAGSDQVGRHQRFAVSRFERVETPEYRGNQRRHQKERDIYPIRLDQIGKGATRGAHLVGCELEPARLSSSVEPARVTSAIRQLLRSRRRRRESQIGAQHLRRAVQHVSRIVREFKAAILRRD